MRDLTLFESEYKMMDIIWENEPLKSGELVRLCDKALAWKKSTTYTVLHKLCDKGIAKNVDSIVTSEVPREKVQEFESEEMVRRSFGGSLPAFVNAFLNTGKLTSRRTDRTHRNSYQRQRIRQYGRYL